MYIIIRPPDFTKEGYEQFKASGIFHCGHLTYNARIYYDKAQDVYFTDDPEQAIIREMRQIK